MAEEGLDKPAGGSNSAPKLGVEGKVCQTWKEVSRRSNQKETVGDRTRRDQEEKRQGADFLCLDDVEFPIFITRGSDGKCNRAVHIG
jgi:hypothetical protein